MSKKIEFSNTLIVGGNGFVGRNLTQHLLNRQESNEKIYVIDNLLSSDFDQVIQDKRVKFIELDAGLPISFDQVPTEIDRVFVLNCLHGNQSSLYSPLLDLDNSLRPVITTLEWVRRQNPKAIVAYAGAGCAVAEKTWSSPDPVEESDVISLDHDSPYSISKLAGEMHCKMYAKQFNLDVRRARFQNVYGPGERLGAGVWRGTNATVWRNVVPSFIWKALNNEELIVTGSDASRDFIFVDDLVAGLEAISQKGIAGEAYNLATGVETRIVDLAKEIIKITNSSSKLTVSEPRSWDNSGRRVADIRKSLNEIDFLATVAIEEGLRKTIDWSIRNLSDIKKSVSKFSNHLT